MTSIEFLLSRRGEGLRRRHRLRTQSERGRRVLNVVVAVVGLILTAPLMLMVALLIKLTSRGPVIYRQERVGLDRRGTRGRLPEGYCRRRRDSGGRRFTIYKFRTMYQQDDPDAQVWATPDDPRVTPLGRFLRKTRIDELPQLFNVIRGDMNIVGPRPEQPEIFCRLSDRIEGYRLRQRAMPGITGWAQINRSYDTDEEGVKAKTALDLEYISRKSALEDFKIMLRTVPVMIFRRGAW